MSPRQPTSPKRKALNVRNFPDDVSERFWHRKVQLRMPFAEYIDRLERLHQVIEREAEKRGGGRVKESVLFARAALKAAGLFRRAPESG